MRRILQKYKSPSLLLTLLLPLLFLSTCKKDSDCPPSEPCPCEGDTCLEEMKDWFYFQPGTYWIYQEENSGALDTVHVYEAGSSSEGFTTRVQSSILEEWIPGQWEKYNYAYRYWGSSICQDKPNCRCHRLNRVKSRPLDFVGAANILYYPFTTWDFFYPIGGGVAEPVELFDSLIVSGVAFIDVQNIYNSECISENGLEVNFFFSKNYGLIRKDLPQLDEVWNLIEYNIVQ
jgi:hypothetical protein